MLRNDWDPLEVRCAALEHGHARQHMNLRVLRVQKRLAGCRIRSPLSRWAQAPALPGSALSERHALLQGSRKALEPSSPSPGSPIPMFSTSVHDTRRPLRVGPAMHPTHHTCSRWENHLFNLHAHANIIYINALPFLQLSSPMVGDDLLPDSMMESTAATSFNHKARPSSSSVNAAAWRAYGSPSARGFPRKSQAPDSPTPSPKSQFDATPG